jgi:hypothetical protein
MRTLVALLAWLAARAGAVAGAADAGVAGRATTADRAGRLVPAPHDGLEPDVSRSLVEHWALWLAVGLVLIIVGIGYVRRRSRVRGQAPSAWLTWLGLR